MINLPSPVLRLIDELSKLPGIGRKTAKRLAFSIIMSGGTDAVSLARSITDARQKLRSCSVCFSLADQKICRICSDGKRNRRVICVVEDPRNVFTIENSNIFNGLYHVLQGAISPLHGVSPENIRIAELERRVAQDKIKELIVSTNPSVEGEATAHYLTDVFKDKVPVISRIARGMPAGGDLEFADINTLTKAFEGRTVVSHITTG